MNRILNQDLDFGETMRNHLQQVQHDNASVIESVIAKMLDAVRNDLRIHISGTGHSTALILEAFYRAGGLACINPVIHPDLIPVLGAKRSTETERSETLASELLRTSAPREGEVVFIFSNSGVNPLPIALAKGFLSASTTVVAVSSLPHMNSVAPRAGQKLDELATYLIDTQVRYGDASFQIGDVRTAGMSSLASIYIWNLLLAGLTARAYEEGVDLPIWTSANTPGADERNAHLFAKYQERVVNL